MKISRRSISIIVVSIYLLTLFCGIERFVVNDFIDQVRKILMIGLPFILNCSFIIDNIKNLGAFKKYKFYLIFIFINIIWYIVTIAFGINIGIQSITGIINFTDIILLLFFISKTEIEEKDKTRIKNAIMYSALIAMIYGVTQYIIKFDLNIFANEKYPGINGRIPSTFYLPTLYDKYSAIIYALALSRVLKEKNIKHVLFAVLAAVNIFLTFSRGGLIAFIIISLVFTIKSIADKKYTNVVIPILTFGLAFLIPGFVYSFQSVANYGYAKLHIPKNLQIILVNLDDAGEVSDVSEDHSINDRNYFNNIGIQFIKENPITGIGINNYSYLYNNQNAGEYLNDTSVLEPDKYYIYPHSGYIMIAAEIGIVGAFLLYAYIFYICYDSFKQKQYLPVLILGIFLLGNYTENLVSNKQYMYIFILIYGILCNNIIKKKK